MKRYLFLAILVTCSSFNALGQTSCSEVTMATRNPKGEVLFEQTQKFDNKGLLVRQQNNYKGATAYTTAKTWQYDAEGRILQEADYRNNQLLRTTFRTYGAGKGSEVLSESVQTPTDATPIVQFTTANGSKNWVDKKGVIRSREEKKYDANGHVIAEIRQDTKGNILAKTERKFTPTGQISHLSRLDAVGSQLWETTYVYDNKKQLVEETTLLNNKPFKRIAYTYDAPGNLLVKETFNAQNVADTKLTYTYSPNKQLLTESYWYKGEEISKKEFGYDTKNNQISQKEYERGQLRRTIERNFLCN